MVQLFRDAEDALLIAPDRFIRTTDPDHKRASQEMVRRAFRNGDVYLGSYEGWYCPNEGFRNATDVVEKARGTICPNHPDVPLQWLKERNWFFRLSAYQERLERHFAELETIDAGRLREVAREHLRPDDAVVLAWAVALPFPLAIVLLWPAIRRGFVGRSELDVGYRALSWNVARTVVASGSRPA